MKKKNSLKKTMFLALSLTLMSGVSMPTVHAQTVDQKNEAIYSTHSKISYYKKNKEQLEKDAKDVLVVFKNEKAKDKVIEKTTDIPKEVEYEFDTTPTVTMKVNEDDIDELEDNPNVLYVEEDVEFQALGNDFKVLDNVSTLGNSELGELSAWNLKSINVTSSWNEGYTGKGVKVAVIDTGVDNHPDLQVAGGVSTVDYTTSYEDDNGHGTHVAGIIGAKKNGEGIVGVAPDAEIYAVKALKANGNGTLTDIAEGIDWAIENNMDVINLSLGTKYESQVLKNLIQKAQQKGIVVVSAGGNGGNKYGFGDNVLYPAKYDEVIAVSAVDETKKRGSFSATGSEIDFSAPGVNILSTYDNGKYAVADGTSQASPHIAGIVALLLQKNPNMTPSEVKEALIQMSEDLGSSGKDNLYGYGLVKFAEPKVETGLTSIAQPTLSDKEIQKLVTDAKRELGYAQKYKKSAYFERAYKAINKVPDYAMEKGQLVSDLKVVAKEMGIYSKYFNDEQTTTNENNSTENNNSTKNNNSKVVENQPTSDNSSNEQKTTEYSKELQKQIKNAGKYVGYAEKYRYNTYIKKARTLVGELPDIPEKEELTKRLDNVVPRD